MWKPARLVPPFFVLLWATGFIGARYAMPWAEPFTFLAARFALTLMLLALLAALFRSRGLPPRQAGHAIVAGALMHGVYLGGVFWAIDHGMPAGLSALIIGLQPLITALLAWAFLKERLLRRHWAGLAAGLAGVVVVLLPSLGSMGAGVTAATVFACVLAVVGMSAGAIWQKRFVSSADIITGTLYQYIGGGALALIGSLALETRQFTVTGELIFALVWLVFVLSIGAIFLLMYLIREGEVSKVASLFYLVPGVTAVLAWALFGEALSLVQIAGLGLATFGVALATRGPTASAAPAPARPDSA